MYNMLDAMHLLSKYLAFA